MPKYVVFSSHVLHTHRIVGPRPFFDIYMDIRLRVVVEARNTITRRLEVVTLVYPCLFPLLYNNLSSLPALDMCYYWCAKGK